MVTALAISLIIFVLVMLALSIYAARMVKDETDFIVAGRSLSFMLTTGTIMATWFGAGTLLVSADTVRVDGISIMGLEPIGVGFSLLFVGWFFAKPLWNANVLTLADIYRNRFGPFTEKLSALYGVSYFGWLAAQVMGLAGILHLFFGIDLTLGAILITTILTIYTILGGMWSVAITDFAQLGLLLVGLTLLTINVLFTLGDGGFGAGVSRLITETPPEKMVLIPSETVNEFMGWLGLFIIGSLGNMAAQDLVQRIFAAKTANMAKRACIISGVAYIVFASLPPVLGLAGHLLLGAENMESVIPALVQQFMNPVFAVIFVLTMAAAVTSTVDSAMLGSASVLSKNLVHPMVKDRFSLLTTTRFMVVVVAVFVTIFAISDFKAIDLLQGSYSLGVPLFVIMVFGLLQKRTYSLAGGVTLVAGLLVWILEFVGGLTDNAVINKVVGGEGFYVYFLVFCFAVYWACHLIAKSLNLKSHELEGTASPN